MKPQSIIMLLQDPSGVLVDIGTAHVKPRKNAVIETK